MFFIGNIKALQKDAQPSMGLWLASIGEEWQTNTGPNVDKFTVYTLLKWILLKESGFAARKEARSFIRCRDLTIRLISVLLAPRLAVRTLHLKILFVTRPLNMNLLVQLQEYTFSKRIRRNFLISNLSMQRKALGPKKMRIQATLCSIQPKVLTRYLWWKLNLLSSRACIQMSGKLTPPMSFTS